MTRRGIIIIVLAALTGGCAVQPVAQLKPAGEARHVASASLAFDAPVTIGQPPLNLSREGRSPEAFVGYESITTTSFAVHTDDRQLDDSNGHQDRFERRSISTKVGVSYR